jgi:hypothetical protein
MDVSPVEQCFVQQIGHSIHLMPEHAGRYRVSTPFTFPDGDVLVIVLERRGATWVLSDEGHTAFHLAHRLEAPLRTALTQRKKIVQVLHMFQVHEQGRELTRAVDEHDYAEAFWSFVQALLTIINVTSLAQE